MPERPTGRADPPSSAGVAPDRRLRVARNLHPGAWWLWAGGLAAAAMRTTNPVLLGLVLTVAAYVVAARRSPAPWARSFTAFLKLGLAVVAIRVAVQVLFGIRTPGTVLFTIPAVELPSWAAGVTLGGIVTVEAVVQAACEGLRLAVVLACFGAVNSLCSPYRLLRTLPAVLYEAGVAVTVALGFAPEAVTSLTRLREARALRGRPTKGARSWRGLAMPVLEGALDRSIDLAASMDARGYGRRGSVNASSRRMAAVGTAGGLLAVCVGVYALLDAGATQAFALPLLGLGSLALALALLAAGRRSPRTRYRPDPWRLAEWATAASGMVAAAAMLVAGAADPTALNPYFFPLAAPALPVVAAAGVLVGLVPAWATPPPPGLTAGRTAAAPVGLGAAA